MAVKRKFEKQFLKDVLSDDVEGVEVVVNDITNTSRWSVHYEMIFKFENKFYITFYSVGATESQDERPFEYDGDIIECTQVEPTQVTVTKYITVQS